MPPALSESRPLTAFYMQCSRDKVDSLHLSFIIEPREGRALPSQQRRREYIYKSTSKGRRCAAVALAAKPRSLNAQNHETSWVRAEGLKGA
jgi:hypothetical protein